MNPSTAFAAVVVDELIRGGCEHAVLAPGSRSAPLALALASAERDRRVRLHVRTDERSAGFLALGLAKGSGRPVPVLTTSGTAAAHLHAAMLEASYSGVALLALTADRPPELRGVGANQTIDQIGLFGAAVRLFVDVDVPERSLGCNDAWRSLACRALAAACGREDERPGAVHLNLPLRGPLLPDVPDTEPWPESLEGRANGGPWLPVVPVESVGSMGAAGRTGAEEELLTWLLLGDTTLDTSELAVRIAQRRAWPILAEPTGNAGASAVPAYLGLLESDAVPANCRPQRVVCVGRPTLSRAVQRRLADPAVRVERFAFGAQWPASSQPIDALVDRESRAPGSSPSSAQVTLLESLSELADILASYQDRIVDEAYLGGAKVARDLVASLPEGARLFLGSSTPIRDVDRHARPRDGVQMLANRGVAGIDGSLSTAVGIALSQRDSGRRTYALIGDLAFLHDLGGFGIPDVESRPDLTLVVVDNRGGGIFAQLEPGEPAYELDYQRVFGTPHSFDLVQVAESLGWPAVEVTDSEQLATELGRGGPRVIVVRTDQRADAKLLAKVRAIPEDLFDRPR